MVSSRPLNESSLACAIGYCWFQEPREMPRICLWIFQGNSKTELSQQMTLTPQNIAKDYPHTRLAGATSM